MTCRRRRRSREGIQKRAEKMKTTRKAPSRERQLGITQETIQVRFCTALPLSNLIVPVNIAVTLALLLSTSGLSLLINQ